MADNVAITAGSGTTISTEELTTLNGAGVSAQHAQRVLVGSRTADGTVVDWQPIVTAATLTNVNDTATSTTLAASNAARKGLLIFNDSTQALYVKYGATASATSFTVKIDPGGYWEMPTPIYSGVVDGVWAADASGAARITEL